MKHNIHKRQWLNFFMIWIFIFEILSNINGVETVAASSFNHQMSQQMQQEAVINKEESSLSSVQSLHGVDDFQIMSTATQNVSPTVEETMGGTTIQFLVAVWAVLLRSVILEKSIVRLTENGRTVFRVIAFIHQMDGKKKNPVLNYCLGQNRRYQDGSWNKI